MTGGAVGSLRAAGVLTAQISSGPPCVRGLPNGDRCESSARGDARPERSFQQLVNDAPLVVSHIAFVDPVLGGSLIRDAIHPDARTPTISVGLPPPGPLAGGRTWWAHLALTRLNIELTSVYKKFEDLRTLGAFCVFLPVIQSQEVSIGYAYQRDVA